MVPDEAFNALKQMFMSDSEHSMGWRQQARDDFSFYAGPGQWHPADRAKLEDQKRPIITFNQVLAVIKAVCGMEINSRRKIAYLPRGGTADAAGVIRVAVNEKLTGASDWMAYEADAGDEQSEAFQDCCICGMGFTEPTIGYDEEPDGKYKEPKVDPIEMYWDRNARAKNLADATRMARARNIHIDAALAKFPGVEPSEIDASWAALDNLGASQDVELRKKKVEQNENRDYADPDCEVTLVHIQWIEMQPYWRVLDPETGEPADVDLTKFSELQKLAREQQINLIATKLEKKVFKQAWLGGHSILGEITDCPANDRFTWQCITGERNATRGTWFGLISLMRDPQLWANKLFSQTLHIMNSTAKGGILAEKGAFENLDEAQDTYAYPDAITIVADGAISGNKLMQKPGTGNPAMYVQLLMFCKDAIRDSTGISMEAMGLADRNQPIGLEVTRKQAAMTILATLFDSFRRFQRNIGRVRLTYIQKYLSNGQLIRLTGADGYQLVPLMRSETVGRFEVIVDDAPTSPNEQLATWETVKSILPVIGPALSPAAFADILDYTPLPVQLRQSIKKALTDPNPAQQQQVMVAIQTALAKIAKDQASAELYSAQAQTEQTKALENLSDINKAEAEALLDRAKADILNSLNPSRSQQLPALLGPRMPAEVSHLPTYGGPAGAVGGMGSGGPIQGTPAP